MRRAAARWSWSRRDRTRRSVFNLLEGQCEVLVVNAYHAKAVPGRKTAVKDAEWLVDLLRHGRHAR
jgi:hypothetical protein